MEKYDRATSKYSETDRQFSHVFRFPSCVRHSHHFFLGSVSSAAGLLTRIRREFANFAVYQFNKLEITNFDAPGSSHYSITELQTL